MKNAHQPSFFDMLENEQAAKLADLGIRKKHKVVSLFSGCGGLDLGIIGGFSFLGVEYAKNSFDIVLANDINSQAVKTQKYNFKNINAICCDVVELVKGDLPRADVLTGGFPCQDYTKDLIILKNYKNPSLVRLFV